MESTKTLQGEIEREINDFFDQVISDLKSQKLDQSLIGLYEKLKTFVSLGGKRLRPISSIMAFQACCPKEKFTPELRKAAIKLAIGFELLHNSTLIHDDIMDQDELRRGSPTVWKMFANSLPSQAMTTEQSDGVLFRTGGALYSVTHGILAGNILVGESLKLISEVVAETNNQKIMQIYIDAYLNVNYGQVEDISGSTGEEEYMRMIDKKTGALFRCAILAGAELAGADNEKVKAFSRYAKEMSAAFQLFDDIMDIDPSSLKGHVPGSDIRQGKMTLLATRALKNAPKDKSEILARALCMHSSGESVVPNELVEECIQIIREYSLESVSKTTNECVKNAKEALENVAWDSEEAIKYFVDLANFSSNRDI